MGKSSPSPPQPPDPTETARAQGAVNRETAIAQARLNMFDEFTPYGQSIWRPINAPTSAPPAPVAAPPADDPNYTNALQKWEQQKSQYDREPDNFFDPGPKPEPGSSVPVTTIPPASGSPALPGEDVQRYSRTVTLDPAQQRIFDQQTGITGDLNELAQGQIDRVSDALAQPFSYEGLPGAPTADAAARQQTIDAIYGQATSRLDPRFRDERSALETRLASQGIGVGSDAYKNTFETFDRGRNDAYDTALNSAIMGGGAEQSRLFGLQGNERERAIQERAYLRNLPLNEVTALMGSGAGIQNPQFSAAPQTGINPVDYAGMVNNNYMGQLNNYNQELRSDNAARGGLFGLAGAGLRGWASAGFPGFG